MTPILGHIAGIPVEETLLMLAPVGLTGIGAAVSSKLQTMRERTRGTPRADAPADESQQPAAAEHGDTPAG